MKEDLRLRLQEATGPVEGAPNLVLLNNALRQTEWPGPLLTSANWKQAVRERLQGIDWERAAADVQPFLEIPSEIDLIREEVVLGALAR